MFGMRYHLLFSNFISSHMIGKGIWHHGNFMKCIVPLILRIFQDTQIISLQNGKRIFQSLMVILFLLLHVSSFVKYVSTLNERHEDVLITLFLLSLEAKQKDWFKHSCSPKSISSIAIFIEEFL
jgi:hypothetical protein